MSNEIFVSFVVIAYNEEANIARTLAAITQLEGLGNHEVIVVDDGSRDSTAQIVGDIAIQNPCIDLIELGENRGRGFARSRGVAAARGELIAMVDADIILPANWLTRTRAALAGHDAVGGIAVPDGDVAYIYKRFKLVPRIVHSTTSVTGNNGLYRREVFDVAGFDPALREGEDSALNHAMDHQGLSCLTVPGLLVRHEESKTLGTSLKWLFETGRGATRQLLTYHEVRQPDLAAGGFAGSAVLGTFLAMRGHRLIGAVIPVGFVLTASIQHVRSRFETPRSHWSKVAPAVAVNSAMLMAYFAGRLVGLDVLWRRPDSAVPAPTRRSPHLGTPGTKASAHRGQLSAGDPALLERSIYSYSARRTQNTHRGVHRIIWPRLGKESFVLHIRPYVRRIGRVTVLATLGIASTVALAPSARVLPAQAAKVSAPFSWQGMEWCPSYHGYNGCNTIQEPSQYTVSFAPFRVSKSGSSIVLTTDDFATSSGAINTYGEEAWTPPTTFTARITVTCNAPGQIVNWPAFWAVGTTGSWPSQGETDIFEGQGGRATWTYHYTDASGRNAQVSSTPAGNWCGTHTYAADWQSSSITFTWDGKRVGVVTSSQIGVPIAADPMYVIFDYGANPALGGPTVSGGTMKLLNYSASTADS